MVDLDSNPTKLMDIVEIGKQLLITRGALTTFSIANDVAKYFAIIPAMFVATYPALDRLNVMHLTSPESAILSAVIFNALIIVLLVPLALRGVRYRPRRRRRPAAPQPADLRPGRDHRPVHRDQAHRHAPRVGAVPMIKTITTRARGHPRAGGAHRAALPAGDDGGRPGRLRRQGERLARRGERPAGRQFADRAGMERDRSGSTAARPRSTTTRPPRRRLQPRAAVAAARRRDRPSRRRRSQGGVALSCPASPLPTIPRRPAHGLRERARPATSPSRRRGSRRRGSQPCADCSLEQVDCADRRSHAADGARRSSASPG